MNLLIIYNPQAANGKAEEPCSTIENYLKKKNVRFQLKITKHQWHAAEITQKECFKNYDAIIASGDDGTLFEVLNGYMQNPSKKRPAIGLIPNGTGNAFMKELGLRNGDWKKTNDLILDCKKNDRYW